MVTDETLRLATDRLVAQFHPQRVILFGSQARGTADARSDVDLLVICSVPLQLSVPATDQGDYDLRA